MKFEDKTAGGYPVRIWTDDAKCSQDYPIRGEVYRDGEWILDCWEKNGKYVIGEQDLYDLVPIRKEWWVNIYPRPDKDILLVAKHHSYDEAVEERDLGCIATISFKEGDGL